MDSMGSNQVWTLVDPPKGVRLVGRKWVYKHKLGADREVTGFKARLVAKGYTQRPGVDFEKTYSPVAMAKSILILLATAACWRVPQLLEKNKKSIVSKGPSTASSKLPKAGTRILTKSYGVMILSRTSMILVYTRRSVGSIAYLVLYVDDILLIRNDVKVLGDIKAWLSMQFSIKDMEIQDGELKTRIPSHGIKLSKKQSPKTDEKLKRMSDIPYASAVGSIQYVVQCTRPDVAYALSVTSRYQACAGEAHWSAVKTILKYLKRTKYIFLIYGGGELIWKATATLASSRTMMPNPSQFLYSSLMVVWLLEKVPSRLPQWIPPWKLNT
ncbi:UNVERIFIED_CONTAM: Retrovirus-related Pol polyprotein from transposon RE2 [Sesamum latifolium]|uniref:Retrovirus-related Pol polyprotein from transposon RE2 n=1 Tax=Sesamum latifolium TaxID=2727402 RepID=A0AAW2TLB0_9LAMI